MARFWETSGSDPVVVSYAEGDGIVTAQLYHAQLALVQEQELGAVKALEDALIWTLVRMERRGLRVDTAYLEQLLEEVRKRAAQALEKLPPGFNPRSCTKVKALAEAAGHTDWPLTANGNPSFSERFLSSFPEGQNVVALRKWTHLENSFIGPLLSEHVHNGRVHAIFNQLKSDEFGTPARLSCSSPNLQQIPKRDKEIATLFRRAFVPDPGMVFYEADWSQAEPRLFAHYSKEPKLIDGYTKEPFRDIHQLTADLLGVPRNPTGKRMAMGILTGMQPRSFADHMGWPLDKAAMMWHKWFEAFPEIRRFQQQARSVMGARGYVKTLLGRRGRLDKPRFAYRAVSRIIQGSSADILKLKLLQIDRMLEDDGDRAHVLCTVHDSIAWQAPDGPIGEELSAHIVQCMEDVQSPPINLRVPFVAEVGRGPDWSVASFGDDHG
jgi:DNA polymerase-1